MSVRLQVDVPKRPNAKSSASQHDYKQRRFLDYMSTYWPRRCCLEVSGR